MRGLPQDIKASSLPPTLTWSGAISTVTAVWTTSLMEIQTLLPDDVGYIHIRLQIIRSTVGWTLPAPTLSILHSAHLRLQEKCTWWFIRSRNVLYYFLSCQESFSGVTDGAFDKFYFSEINKFSLSHIVLFRERKKNGTHDCVTPTHTPNNVSPQAAPSKNNMIIITKLEWRYPALLTLLSFISYAHTIYNMPMVHHFGLQKHDRKLLNVECLKN